MYPCGEDLDFERDCDLAGGRSKGEEANGRKGGISRGDKIKPKNTPMRLTPVLSEFGHLPPPTSNLHTTDADIQSVTKTIM